MDGLSKVRPGEPLHIPAKAYNAFVDAAMAHQQRSMSTAGAALRDQKQSNFVLVKNESGAARAQFDILGIEGPIISPADNGEAFRTRIALRGVTPTAAHVGRFVILHDALPPGAVGRAYLTGACLARVRMQDETHTAADVDDGETGQLASADTGAASLLWIEPIEDRDDPEIAWAVVRFGGGTGSGGTISVGSSFDAALTAWEQFDTGDGSNPLFRYEFEERIFTAAGAWIPAEHLHTITYAEHSNGSAGSGTGAGLNVVITSPVSGGRIIDEPESYDPPGPTAAYDAIDLTLSWDKDGNDDFWIYVGTAATGPSSNNRFDSGALGDVDTTTVKAPKSGTFYITLFFTDGDIDTDYAWRVYEVTVTPRTMRTSTSLGVLAVNEEEVNEKTLAALRGPIGGGSGGTITDEIVVRLRPLTMYDEDTGEATTIYTFWRPKVPWVGVTVAHDPEFEGNRYDVARAQVSNTDSDAASKVAFTALAGDDAETVTATNLLEQVDETHLLPEGTPVVVLPVRGGDNPHVPRYVFLGAMGGGIEIGEPDITQDIVEDGDFDGETTCELTLDKVTLTLTPVTIQGTGYFLIKSIT